MDSFCGAAPADHRGLEPCVVGGWWSVPLIALALVWIWLNPRVFPRPASTDNWASKGVLGERVWLNRKRVPIPRHHERILRVINCATAFGALVLVYGLIVLDGSATLIGMVVVFLGKSWFLDRMVWLYEDMREQHRGYETWLY